MKAKLTTVDNQGILYPALVFICPGCDNDLHMLAVNTDQHSPSWTFDGNLEAPTLSPSILSTGTVRCHSFLRAGVFEFLDDCTHELAGQHVPMPDLPDWISDSF